jgi:hypothetical protein
LSRERRRQAMEEVVYRSHVTVERLEGPLRRATLPAGTGPVFFGVHSEIAEHYGLDPAVVEANPATLDYLVAAAAG